MISVRTSGGRCIEISARTSAAKVLQLVVPLSMMIVSWPNGGRVFAVPTGFSAF
jgi:hypothetical protein